MNEPSANLSPYDFHLHTWWSYDATAELEDHFRQARRLGLTSIAITEHHHLDSLPAVLEVAARYPDVRAVPAAEVSVTTSVGAIDLLCYGLPLQINSSPLGPVVERYHDWQREAGAAVSEGMLRLGFPYSDEVRLELLRTYRPEKAIAQQGITHVNNNVQRRFFLEQGFIRRDADYQTLITEVAKAAKVPPYPGVEEVVAAVHASGGFVVIAHPQRYFDGADSKRMDQLRSECSLDGIECAHPNVAPELTPIYRDYCRRHGLVSVAGSDAHTAEDIDRWMGRHGGDAAWLEEFLDRLDG